MCTYSACKHKVFLIKARGCVHSLWIFIIETNFVLNCLTNPKELILVIKMVPLKLLHSHKLPSSVMLPSVYVERKNRCADVQLRNACRNIFEQRQKYVKSLSKRKITLILEVKEMKRVNSESIKYLDSTKKVDDDNRIGSPRITLTRYTKIRPRSKQRKSGNLKQNTTAEEFLRLRSHKLHDDNDDDGDKRNHHKDLISEPEVLEFEDIKPELPTEKAEQNQLISMVRRFRLSSLGNRTIQQIRHVQERKDMKKADAERRRRKSQRDIDIHSDGCSSDSEDSIFLDDHMTQTYRSGRLFRANTVGSRLTRRKREESRPFSYREKTTVRV